MTEITKINTSNDTNKDKRFGELSDETYFKTVKVIPSGTGIECLNGQNIAPHELYELSS